MLSFDMAAERIGQPPSPRRTTEPPLRDTSTRGSGRVGRACEGVPVGDPLTGTAFALLSGDTDLSRDPRFYYGPTRVYN